MNETVARIIQQVTKRKNTVTSNKTLLAHSHGYSVPLYCTDIDECSKYFKYIDEYFKYVTLSQKMYSISQHT